MQNQEWETKGGKIEIPNGCFVYDVNLDANPPYAIIMEDGTDCRISIKIPKSLAFYLVNHFCGSEKMVKGIEERTRRKIGRVLKKELLL